MQPQQPTHPCQPNDEPEQIKKALSALSPHTRDSLLTLLLSTQQGQQRAQQTLSQPVTNQPIQQTTDHPLTHDPLTTTTSSNVHSTVTDYSFLGDWNIHSEPINLAQEQRLSPHLTPLSTFSTGSYQHSSSLSDTLHQPFHPSNHQLEFFSPLTSPALRPLGYHTHANEINLPHNIPALIDQAATLGLSTPQPFIPLSSNTSQHDLNLQPLPTNYLAHSTPSIFPSKFIIHSNHQTNQLPISNDLAINHHADPINQSPLLLPHQSSNNLTLSNPNSSPRQPQLSGRPRPARSSKNRPSPLIRPIDDSSKTTDDRNGSAKRARSLTGLSVPTSPDFPSVLAKIGLADSPSPIDLHSREINLISSSSSSLKDNMTNNSIPPPTPPTIPLPQALSTISESSKTWHIQPMTPASLLNFEKPLLAASSGIGDSTQITSQSDDLASAKLDSVVETDESGDVLIVDKPNDPLDDQGIIIQDHHHSLNDQPLQIEQNRKTQKSNEIKNNVTKTKRERAKEDEQTLWNKEGQQQQQLVKIGGKEGVNIEEEGPEYRKSSHKVAEQRRRDSLKMCFEDLRQLLPPINWNEKGEQFKRPGEGNVGGQRSLNAFDPSNPNKGMSKVALLRRSNEYIICLKKRLKKRDGAIERMVQILEENNLSENSFTDQHHQHNNSKEPSQRNGECSSHEKILVELKSILTQIGLENQEDNVHHSSLHHKNTSHTKSTSTSSLSEELE